MHHKWSKIIVLLSLMMISFSGVALAAPTTNILIKPNMVTPLDEGNFIPTQMVTLTLKGSYQTGVFDEGAAEIVTHDPVKQVMYVVNGDAKAIDIISIVSPANPVKVGHIDITPYGNGINSVAFYNYGPTAEEGVVAAAVEADPKQELGKVVFFDRNGTMLNEVTVGALPDMVGFTPNGNYLLAANEGEPNDEYTNDPQGSITIINLTTGVANATVSTAGFEAYIGQEAMLRAKGVRLYGPNANAAEDLEPEYIAFTADSQTAVVTLQENNAVAVVDIVTATVVDIMPLGVVDHNRGPIMLNTYEFDLPMLGVTTPTLTHTNGQEIYLGGFSGLWFEGYDEANGTYQFATVPDRGPNGAPTDVDNDDKKERPFILPDYEAQMRRFVLNPTTSEITLTQTITFMRADGVTPISGLPNIEGWDEEPVDLFGNLLPYDPYGADMEGVIVTDNAIWTVDEYRPAIYHFSLTGTLIARYIPTGTNTVTQTYGTETLPADYNNRRPNRGFEAMALDTDNGILYAFIQTPLSNPDRATGDASQIIRMIGINPTNGHPVAEYVYLLEKPNHRPGGTVDKMGDAIYAGDGKFYVVERDSAVGSMSKKYLFEIDLLGATNVLSMTIPGTKTLEAHTPDELLANGIRPVFKEKITNLPSIGYVAGDKVEGLAMINEGPWAGALAILNDNDFGLLDEEIPGDGTVALDPNPVPEVLGILKFAEGNKLDASDKDNRVNIQNWPVHGFYMPDMIASYTMSNTTYFVTANEGDTRDYDEYSEEARIADLTLDPTIFSNADTLQNDENLGRLLTTKANGDLDGDGDVDRLYAIGGRGFSIWDQYGNLVYNSGDWVANITAQAYPNEFNADNDENGSFDSRSDAKGTEPEAIEIGMIDGRYYAFLGLERMGGVMVFDITNPTQPTFEQYLNNRDFSVADVEADLDKVGDLGPEGIKFVTANDSPTGAPLLLVANEVSGSTTVYQIGDSTKAEIVLAKTVSTDGSCGQKNDMMAYTGDNVTYCYTVTNIGPITLTTHSLVDDKLGLILDNAPLVLAPQGSASFTKSTTFTQTGMMMNTAIFTAMGNNQEMAVGMAMATVMITSPHQTGVTVTLLHNNDGESTIDTLTYSTPSDHSLRVAGVAAYKAVLDREMNEATANGNTVLNVYAGDAFLASASLQCSLPIDSDKPVYDALAQQMMHYDAHIIGNHEFDLTPDFLKRFMQGFTQDGVLNHPFLSGNLDFSGETGYADMIVEGGIHMSSTPDGKVVAQSAIIMKDGHMFGLVSAVTPDLPTISAPRDVQVTTSNITETAQLLQTQIDALEEKGVNKIILVSHLQNLDVDKDELIPQLKGVDIAVGGGGDEMLVNQAISETIPITRQLLPGERASIGGNYPEMTKDADDKTVYIVTTAGNYKYAGRLDIVFDADGNVTEIVNEKSYPRRVIPNNGDNATVVADLGLTDAVTPDSTIQTEVVDQVASCLDTFAQTIVATTTVELDVSRGTVRGSESNAGNLIADSYLYVLNKYATNNQLTPNFDRIIAIQNGGGIRQNAGDKLPVEGGLPGPITMLDTMNVLAFATNKITFIQNVTPTELKAIFERAVSRIGGGQYLQVSGLTVVYDPEGQAQVVLSNGTIFTTGERVMSITLADGTVIVEDGQVVADAPNIGIVTNSFTAGGGDNYVWFANKADEDKIDIRDSDGVKFSYDEAWRQYLQDDAQSRLAPNTGLGGVVPNIPRYQLGGEGRVTTPTSMSIYLPIIIDDMTQ